MKKKVLAMLLCLCMAFVLLPTTAFAETTFTVDGLSYRVIAEPSEEDAGIAELSGVPGGITSVNMGTVTNDGKIYTVMDVGNGAFQGCTELTSVTLPNAAYIRDYAFQGCTSLTTVTMPKATSIGSYAFQDCTGLTELALPYAGETFENVFSGCTNLKSVTIWIWNSGGGTSFSGVPAGCTLYAPAASLDAYQSAGWPTGNDFVGLWAISGTVYGADGLPVAGATVSVDGISAPTNENGVYTVYVKPNQTSTITARLPGQDGRITVTNATDNLGDQDIRLGIAAPICTPAGGRYTTPQSVTLSCALNDAFIYYTTDGREPTESSTMYSGAIPITRTTTIKAKAFCGDMTPSETMTATYTFPSNSSGHDDNTPSQVTVYNDPTVPNASMCLSGAGLSSSDQLVIERSPQGAAYEALLDLAGSHRVFNTYDISLKSGAKSTAGAADLHFNLDAKYAGEDFTLVHQKGDGTYEYFYDAANANGGLDFGPLYELSPFMLVEGKLLGSPKTADGAQPTLWLGMLLMASAGLAVSAALRRKRQNG